MRQCLGVIHVLYPGYRTKVPGTLKVAVYNVNLGLFWGVRKISHKPTWHPIYHKLLFKNHGNSRLNFTNAFHLWFSSVAQNIILPTPLANWAKLNE